MAMIAISDLNLAGSELFADTENFLTELQDTDSNQVFGGSNKCGGGSKKKKSNKGGSKGGSKGGGYGYGGGCGGYGGGGYGGGCH
jgi:hypothetical protein